MVALWEKCLHTTSETGHEELERVQERQGHSQSGYQSQCALFVDAEPN